jgi:hypothetical protein
LGHPEAKKYLQIKTTRDHSNLQVLGLMGCAPSLQSTYARRFLQLFLPPLRRSTFGMKTCNYTLAVLL